MTQTLATRIHNCNDLPTLLRWLTQVPIARTIAAALD